MSLTAKLVSIFSDTGRLTVFLIVVAIWVIVVLYLTKTDKVKEVAKEAFRNVEEDESRSDTNQASSGLVFDMNNNKVLTMDMNPINEGMPDVFVPKYGTIQNSGEIASAGDVYIPTPNDYGIKGAAENKPVENSIANNHESKSNKNNDSKSDLTTDINALVNLLVRGEEKPVFEHMRRMKEKGVPADEFSASVVMELDMAYRAKIEGETNRRNIVLSQIVSHWSRPKTEAVMNALLSIVDKSYMDQNVGTKVALMRIMRVN